MASSLSPLLILGAGYLLYASGALADLGIGTPEAVEKAKADKAAKEAAATRTSAPATGTSSAPAGSSSLARKPCDQVPGVQYVEKKGSVYNVVIGGAVVASYDDQTSAEREYNRRLGC
jgi:hypothetical protein